MHTKIILVAIIFLMGGFFYLHEMNPQRVDFVLDEALKFNLPVTAFVALGFFFGVVLMVFNALSVDIKRVFHDFRIKMEQKKHDVSEDKHRRGVEELLKGNASKAVLFLEKSLLDYPDDIDIATHLAKAYSADGNYKAALKLLRSSVKDSGGKLELFFEIYKTAKELNDIQSAEKALDDVLRVDSKNKVALTELRNMAVSLQNWGRALGCQELIVALKMNAKESALEKSTLAGILYELASIEYEGDRVPEALDYLGRALKVDSTFVPAYVLKSVLQTVSGNVFNSKKTLLKGVDKTGDPALYGFLEDLHISENTVDQMLDIYSKGIAKNPGDIELKLLSAKFFLRLDMVDEANKLLEELYYSKGSGDSNEGESGFYIKTLLAESYSRKGMKDKALNFLKQSLGVDSDLSPHYVCSNCKIANNEWAPRCKSCGRWNTSHMNRDSIFGAPLNVKNNLKKIKY